MTEDNTDKTLSRRHYLTAAGATGVAALAGCANGGSGSGDGEGGSGGSNELEILHGWTGGDGQAAFQSMLEGFEEAYPDVTVNDKAIGGGGNTSLNTRINVRLGNDNPSSSWADWPGKNLLQFTEAGLLGDIEESVWSQNDMKEAYVSGPQQAARPDGTYVAVPTNIHRMNNLFYNPSVVEAAGVDVSAIETPADLTDALAQVEENTDAVGMAQSTQAPWTTIDLWAAVYLGQSGWDTYQEFMAGEAETGPIADAFKTINAYSEYFNSDAGTVGWQEANNLIIDGGAAFFHQGDWAAGMYAGTDDFEYGTDWDQITFPGTEGLYSINMDSWVYPANNPSPAATEKWLTYVGTTDAQVRFNTHKGSIPPRSDVPMDEFSEFQTNQYSDFQDSTAQPPSTGHGLATTPEVLSNLKTAVSQHYSEFTDSAAEATAQAFVGAFDT
ncbi:glucose/mannose transport system substrate-binding protein [Halarchaeum rubridurum]|uniref:Glucose/mannose transport system substrate-binding protein n=1 Tax=Halarchaeum rubridurum TaxID=489911 RepID=A0A830FT10_9EURY|nr:ABC transporter substrate-binding protein [Halarchaeum rubridurum]MBP1953888.1 glucose/mannose transport system substrate-binding protein [Halarchaeum rubridurum]GGM55615.1 sugar ABC transporter substrate-binding protein [Halarchaeum rubridurum]